MQLGSRTGEKEGEARVRSGGSEGLDGEETYGRGEQGRGSNMHLPCSSPPPRRFSLFPPLCSLPCTPSLSCSPPPAARFSVSLSILPSRPSLSALLPFLSLPPPVFSFVLRCFHCRYSFYAPATLPLPTIPLPNHYTFSVHSATFNAFWLRLFDAGARQRGSTHGILRGLGERCMISMT